MKNSMKSLMITAAVSGLLGGTAARLGAAETAPHTDGSATVSSAVNSNITSAGKVSFRNVSDQDTDKHSCKGKNDCKGKGGCKASSNGCKAKNDCKGKGGCATDGSKPPQIL